MRKIALTGLGGVVALNGLIGYAGLQLETMMNLRLQHYGAKAPGSRRYWPWVYHGILRHRGPLHGRPGSCAFGEL